jgi:hypothetical protein
VLTASCLHSLLVLMIPRSRGLDSQALLPEWFRVHKLCVKNDRTNRGQAFFTPV